MKVSRDWITRSGLRAVVGLNSIQVHVGYVAVDPGHPLHGIKYTDESPVLQARLDSLLESPIAETDRERMGVSLMLGLLCGQAKARADHVLRVHGGLTFSSEKPGEPYPAPSEASWWFGFDCGHAGDFAPGLVKYSPHMADGVYRDQAFAEEECEFLAQQLAEIGGAT